MRPGCWKGKRGRGWAPLVPILAFVVCWELGARLELFPGKLFLPPFSRVAAEFGRLIVSGVLWAQFYPSLVRVAAGFLLGAAAGLAVGTAMGCSRLFERSFSPLFSLFYPIPALGWLPLFMLWFGIGPVLPVAVVFVCAFFPILYTTAGGIRGVAEEYVDVARTLGATRITVIGRVLLPLSLPAVFTGLRLEAGMAWRVIVAAEMIAVPTGIGAFLLKSESMLRIDRIIVCLMVLAAMCLAFERLISILEKRLTGAWAPAFGRERIPGPRTTGAG
ncbi:MAG TPA: ABC transporter permease [bacterium]|nr:ABC transporter permease [bacterium]HPQ66392.1 ABC transporter permease [bacterium]